MKKSSFIILIFSLSLAIILTCCSNITTTKTTKRSNNSSNKQITQTTLKGSIKEIRGFYSPELGNSKTLRIYLPYNYEKDTEKKYPVIYMNDGQNLYDVDTASYNMEWNVDETLVNYTLIK